jgi:hypothetical protein
MSKILVAITFSLLSASGISQISPCELIDPWNSRIDGSFQEGLTAGEVAEYQHDLRQTLEQVTDRIYDLRDELAMLPADPFEECMRSAEWGSRFYAALFNTFYERSLADLAATGSPMAMRLAEAVKNNPPNSFRVVGHLGQGESPTGGMGGAHRTTRSIFMDIGKIPKEEWPMILAHELIHTLDTKIKDAVISYNRPSLIRAFVSWDSEGTTYESLTTERRVQLDAWILAGLDRGLLAEWRAWTVTFALMEELVQLVYVTYIPEWCQSYWNLRNQGYSVEQATALFLDPNFTDPTDGVFSKSLIREALAQKRADIRNGSRRLDLGPVLSHIVGQ